MIRRTKNSLLLKIALPVLLGLLCAFLVGTWAYNERNLFRQQTEAIVYKESEVIFEAVKSIIQTQMFEGRIDRFMFDFILSNVVHKTSIQYISIESREKLMFEMGIAPKNVNSNALETLGVFCGDIFYRSKTFEFLQHPPPPPHGNKMPFKLILDEKVVKDFPDKFFDFRGSKQQITLGLDAASFLQQIKKEDIKLLITYLISLASIIILVLAWIHFIKNNNLKFELEKAKNKTEKLEELGLTAAGLAHEVKNPLGIIRGFAQNMVQHKDDNKLVETLAVKIIDQTDITTERLSDFINYAKRRTPRLNRINAVEAVMEIVDMMQFEFDDKTLKLEHDLDDITIEADKEFFQQIIVNILMNSIRACKSGGFVKISFKKKQNYAHLIIADNGSGVSSELLKNIFKPYVSANNKGHGIGLAIVKKLVEEHGWEINMTSELNTGTRTEISKIKCI